MREPPRDASHYRLTVHAAQKHKERGISKDLIAETIREGITQLASGGWPKVRFIHHPAGVNDPIAVVADAEDKEIVTVYWNHKYDDPRLPERSRQVVRS